MKLGGGLKSLGTELCLEKNGSEGKGLAMTFLSINEL